VRSAVVGGVAVVEFVCNPPKKVVVLECTEYPSLEALTKVLATFMQTGSSVVLRWTEGIAFLYTYLPPTTDGLMKEFLEGRVYWSDVIFALMPEYKPIIRVGTIDIPLIDVTPNHVLREAAKWMKMQEKAK
jgi:hypothetical protein